MGLLDNFFYIKIGIQNIFKYLKLFIFQDNIYCLLGIAS
jgi:hypothetical protein